MSQKKELLAYLVKLLGRFGTRLTVLLRLLLLLDLPLLLARLEMDLDTGRPILSAAKL